MRRPLELSSELQSETDSPALKGFETQKDCLYDRELRHNAPAAPEGSVTQGGGEANKEGDELSDQAPGEVEAAGKPASDHRTDNGGRDAGPGRAHGEARRNQASHADPSLRQHEHRHAHEGGHGHHSHGGPLLAWDDEDQEEIEQRAEVLWEIVERFVDEISFYIEETPELRGIMERSSTLERHRELMLEHLAAVIGGNPRSEEFQTRSRRMGRTHIAMGVAPSTFVLLYNRWFAAMHALQDDGIDVPPTEVLRRLWQWDLSTSLDAYHEGLLNSWSTERGRLEETVSVFRRLASTDPLTGLPNRSAIQELITQHASRNNGPAYLVLLDLDHFKKINDRLGHPSGDRALSVIGKALASSVRRSDAVARIGGDEFCLWVTGLGSEHDLVEQLRRLVAGLPLANLGIGISAGAAHFPNDGADFASLYTNADKALYVAKRDGRGSLCISGDSSAHSWK